LFNGFAHGIFVMGLQEKLLMVISLLCSSVCCATYSGFQTDFSLSPSSWWKAQN
jgi:hypothetical protein